MLLHCPMHIFFLLLLSDVGLWEFGMIFVSPILWPPRCSWFTYGGHSFLLGLGETIPVLVGGYVHHPSCMFWMQRTTIEAVIWGPIVGSLFKAWIFLK